MAQQPAEELKQLILQAHAELNAECGCGAFSRPWTHAKSGGVYMVKDVALREDDLVPLVCYFRVGEPQVVFTRPVNEFVERFIVFVEEVKQRPYRNELPPYEALRKRLAEVAFGDVHGIPGMGYDKVLEEFDITQEEAK